MKPSATLQVAQMARDLKAQGRDIISLSTGEPDFRTPRHIIEAANRAALDGKTSYPPVHGVNELRQAIASKLWRDNNLTVDPQNIVVTSGAKQAISNALVATIDPGDEVIIPAPYWVSYPELVTLLGGSAVVVATTAPRFTLTPEQLERAITPRTKWLLLNSPSNPTGSTYSAEEFRMLEPVLERHPHVLIMTDEIYEYLVYDGVQFTSFSSAVPSLRERTVTINGVSKAYAMTGWRIGYAAGRADLINAMAKVQGQLSSGANTPAQYAAAAALNGPRNEVDLFVRTYADRRKASASILSAAPGIKCPLPDGAFYLFPEISALIGRATRSGTRINSDECFARELLAAEGVAVVPGAAFGAPGFFRTTFAVATESLLEASLRIKRFCESLE